MTAARVLVQLTELIVQLFKSCPCVSVC